MSRYWVSWYATVTKVIEQNEEDGDLVERAAPQFPPSVSVLGEWTTGWRMSDDAATVCALIDAASEAEITDALSDFEIRFIEPRPSDYTPGDRFPMANS